MSDVVALDGSDVATFGSLLHSALTVSAAMPRPFTLHAIRAGDARPGLRPEHTALVRAAALACGAKLGGAFDGSSELRFEPGAQAGGDFHFELPEGAPATRVVECLAPVLASGQADAQLELVGSTHVSGAATPEFLSRLLWPLLERCGLRAELALERASFTPGGRGGLRLRTQPWQRGGPELQLETRGALLGLFVLSCVGRLGRELAERQAQGVADWLWEHRRLEVSTELLELSSVSPGACLLAEARFEGGSAGFAVLAEKALAPEALGERLARRLLRFVEEETAVLDPLTAERAAVPLALARRGARFSTSEVTSELLTACVVLRQFDFKASTWGRAGGPGGCELSAC